MFKKRLLQLLKRCVAALLMVVLPAQAFAYNALPKDLGRLDNALVHPALAGDKNALEGNFGLGQSAGQNAVENNYLTTRDLERVASWMIGLIQNGAECWRDQTAAVGDGPVRTPGRTRT
jgi:hypothetical protein